MDPRKYYDDASDASYQRQLAEAEVDRAAREAGYKSPLRRLFGRLRPHRQAPGGDPQSNYGTSDGPGH